MNYLKLNLKSINEGEINDLLLSIKRYYTYDGISPKIKVDEEIVSVTVDINKIYLCKINV